MQLAIINNNKENLENSSKYLDILFTIYQDIKNNNKSLIYLTINEFESSFKDMIMKLKNAGVNFRNNNCLVNMKYEIDNKSSFITTPIKIEPIKHKDEWENQKEVEQKIELDFKNDLKKKINFQNIKAQRIKHINTKMNEDKINEDTLNSLDDISNKNISKMDDEEKDIKFEDLLIQDDDLVLVDERDEKKIEKKNMTQIMSLNTLLIT